MTVTDWTCWTGAFAAVTWRTGWCWFVGCCSFACCHWCCWCQWHEHWVEILLLVHVLLGLKLHFVTESFSLLWPHTGWWHLLQCGGALGAAELHVFWESCWLTREAIHGCGGGLRLASLLSFSIRVSYFSFISLTPWFSSSTVLSVIDAVVDSLWSPVSVAWGCKMASFAISPSSCTIFCRTSLHSGHLQWKEWKQPGFIWGWDFAPW